MAPDPKRPIPRPGTSASWRCGHGVYGSDGDIENAVNCLDYPVKPKRRQGIRRNGRPVPKDRLKPSRPFEKTKIDQMAGILKYSGKPVSIDQMEAAIKKGALERK